MASEKLASWLWPTAEPLLQALIAGGTAFIIGIPLMFIVRLLGRVDQTRTLLEAVSYIDEILKTRIAPLTGITLGTTWRRWTVFFSVFLFIALFGAVAPPIMAIIAVACALFGLLAIYRIWEADEVERQELAETGNIIPHRNDYANEILVGLGFALGLFALGFSRLSEIAPLYEGESRIPIASTALFVWGEFLKAVPIVDASEVFGWGNVSGLEASGGLSRSVTFGLRVFFDLVLITAVLRAVMIIRRISSGHDLREIHKQLAEGSQEKVREGVEHAISLALRGLPNSQRLLSDIALGQQPEKRNLKLEMRETAASGLDALVKKFGSLSFAVISFEAWRYICDARNRTSHPYEWGSAHNNLGDALTRLGQIGGDFPRLKEAIVAYNAALEVYSREPRHANWATTQRNLGNAYTTLGEISRDISALEEAVQSYHRALEELQRDNRFVDWALTQNNLGNTLSILGNFEQEPKRLEKAVEAYLAAIEIFLHEKMMSHCVDAQINLGNAFFLLGGITGDINLFEEAIEAYRMALKQHIRDTMPSVWAKTQSNLGGALTTLAEGPARLKEAIQAYRAALEYYTREATPLDWAATQSNLGVALSELEKFTNERKWLKEAIVAYNAALEVYSREPRHANWATTQRNLADDALRLGRMEQDAARIEYASVILRELTEFHEGRGDLENAESTKLAFDEAQGAKRSLQRK